VGERGRYGRSEKEGGREGVDGVKIGVEEKTGNWRERERNGEGKEGADGGVGEAHGKVLYFGGCLENHYENSSKRGNLLRAI